MRPSHCNQHYTFVMFAGLVTLFVLVGAEATAHQRGVELYKQQKYADAIATLQEAIKQESAGSSDYQESALMIGQSYFQLAQAPKAVPWLEKAPASNETNYMLGYAYLQASDEAKSVAAFAKLFGLKPESAAAHLLAGQMMLKQQYEAQAETELEKALALDPKLPELHFLLGEIAIFRGGSTKVLGV